MNVTFGAYYTLIMAVLVLMLGKLMTRHIRFLRDFNIPEPVSGGLVVAAGGGAGLALAALDVALVVAGPAVHVLVHAVREGDARALGLGAGRNGHGHGLDLGQGMVGGIPP